MTDQTPPPPGARILCRDAEWLVTRVKISDYAAPHFAVHCIGVDDLVRGHESIFLTQLEQIELVDPRPAWCDADQSNGYRLSKLFLEAQLRQMPATGVAPDLTGMGVFTPMPFQEETVRRALLQLRPRLLLADAVGLGKTMQVGMILTELLRRGRADRILVLAKKSMLTQFQAELWNRFTIPLVRLGSAGIAKLGLRIPSNKNPFEVYHRVIISLDTLKNVARYEHFLKDTRWDVVIIDEALEEMLGLAAAAQAESVPATPGDFTQIQRTPNFDLVLVEGEEDLKRILEWSLEEWRIFLHPSQRKLVTWEIRGPMSITGAAGTGKTVALMHRAVHLAKRLEDGKARLLVTTFTTTLSIDIKQRLRRLGPEVADRIEVTNLHALARIICTRSGWRGRIATDEEIAEIWESVWRDTSLASLSMSRDALTDGEYEAHQGPGVSRRGSGVRGPTGPSA